MDPRYLQLIHVVAAFGVVSSLGAIILGAQDRHKKLASAVHGISLLFLLLVGLHMIFSMDLAKTGGWWHAKIVLWLALGVAPVFAKRKLLSPPALMGVSLGIAAVAAYLGMLKPF